MPTPKLVAITGGSSFLGTSLAEHLAARGWQVRILSRHPPRRPRPGRFVRWDPRLLGAPAARFAR